MRRSRLDVGMPDVLADQPVPDPRTSGLGPGQREVLAHLLRGRSCVVDAVAGTGKSGLARIYCDMRLSAAAHPIRLYLVGPAFPPSLVPEYAAFEPWGHAEMFRDLDAFRRSSAPDARAVLLVDEATFLGPEVLTRLGEFDQVALFGDSTQEVLEPGRSWAGLDPSDPRVPTFSLTTSVRGLNESRYEAASFLSYGGSLDEVPVSSRPAPDHVRFATCPAAPDQVAFAAYLRSCRNVLHNPQGRCALLLSEAGGAQVVRDLVGLSPFKRQPFRLLDPFEVQGLETDIIVLSSADVDAGLPDPASAYPYLRMILGRSRSRMEVLLPSGADGPFTRLVCLYMRHGFSSADLRSAGYGALQDALEACGLGARFTSEGIVVHRPPRLDDPSDKGADLASVAFAGEWGLDVAARRFLRAQRGGTRLELPSALLRDGAFDPADPWFARLVETASSRP